MQTEQGRPTHKRRSGRAAALVLAVAALASTLAACGGEDEPAATTSAGGGREVTSERLVFADYAGTARDAHVAAFDGPFSDATGVTVVHADADPAKLELFAENGRAEWDLIDLDAWDIVRFADEGLLAKLPDDVARSENVPAEYRDYAVGGYTSSMVLAYDPEKVQPKSWADFFDTEKFPGKRALPPFPLLEVMAALLADGVPCDELYPLDLDRAFAKLDEIKDDVLIYDSFAQGQQFLLQGSVVMEIQPNGRIQTLKDQGMPVDFLWTDALHIPWVAKAVPKDAPHPDAAFAMLDLMHEPANQAEFSRHTNYGPMNTAALDELDEATLAKLPNAPENAEVACEVDPVAIAEQWDEYAKRYSEWLASL
jgi:putative spermidine/putrescine transport system substrate-binding protein